MKRASLNRTESYRDPLRALVGKASQAGYHTFMMRTQPEPFLSPSLPPNHAVVTETAGEIPIVIDRLEVAETEIFVLRDDLVRGGTKYRACRPYLERKIRQGAAGFVYASPFAGFAQVAMAAAAAELGVPCWLICEEDKTASEPGQLHAFSRIARSYGATVNVVESLAQAEAIAHLTAANLKVEKIPLGFDDPEFRQLLGSVAEQVWLKASQISKGSIRRVWLPVGSGTLTRSFRAALPDVELKLVDVGVLSETDPRIARLWNLPNSDYARAPEKFSTKNEIPAPIPSNAHYDAKLWRFILANAQSGDLWWNVAR